jgi:hypothetical protein
LGLVEREVGMGAGVERATWSRAGCGAVDLWEEQPSVSSAWKSLR